MAIQLLMAAHHQLLQLLNQMAAVAALLGQRQLLAQVSIAGGKILAVLGLGFAAFKALQLLGKGLSTGLVAALK